MDKQIDLRGASGAVYRYRWAEGDEVRTPTGGNFVYVATDGEAVVVVYAGASPSLATGAWERWREAVAQHGATHLFTRLNVASAARGHELGDLVEELRPIMNVAAPADHG